MNPAFDSFHGTQARRLVPIFLVWKLALLLLAAFSPGPGYDTSGLILLNSEGNHFEGSTLLGRIALKLLRWDAFYFVKASQRSYLYEQEWAFSRTYSRILDVVQGYISVQSEPALQHHVWAGIVVSNVFHLISVLVLYRLVRAILNPTKSGQIPFIAAALHIFSPAGLFLSAPYSESLFAALNFSGMLHYVLARQTGDATGTWTRSQDAYMLSSGVQFACATLIRSNGLLSGIIFLYDVASSLPDVLAFQLGMHDARRVFATSVAGSLLALGFVAPQYLAYEDYCKTNSTSSGIRPWCESSLPSIYSWVQSHYWNVGFLRYWTISNLPLFLIAAPMLWILFKSSATVLQDILYQPSAERHGSRKQSQVASRVAGLGLCSFPQLALPQLVLCIAATTSFHVQVINRLSSGYPIWYLVVATWVAESGSLQSKSADTANPWVQWIPRWMIIYSLVQGMLFAGFLPPA